MVRVFNLSMYYTRKTGREQAAIFKCVVGDCITLSLKTLIIHGLVAYNKFKFFVVVLARFELATVPV